MLRVYLIISLVIAMFLLLPATNLYAGAFPCEATECDTEESCNDFGNCAVGGGEGLPCSWCGTFCADICPREPVSVVPTMGQWGMIFAGIVLGFIGIFSLIRERKINRYFD